MDSIRRQLDLIRDEMRNVLNKLSASQKISVLLLALIVALGVALVTNLGVSDSYATLSTPPDSRDLEKMLVLLDQHQIPYKQDGEGETIQVRVPKGEVARARFLTIKSGVFSSRKRNLDWLWADSGLTGETRDRMRTRVLESRKRDVEDAIRTADPIRDVMVMIQRGPEPVIVNQSNDADTASVSVELASGVTRLSTGEASTIRNVVSASFNIRSENIQVADNNLNTYPYVETGPAGHGFSEQEENTRGRVLAALQGIYGRMFLPSDFVVSVLVDVSQRKQHVVEQDFKAEAVTANVKNEKTEEKGTRDGGSPPGVSPNAGVGSAPVYATGKDTESRTQTSSEFEARFPQMTTETQIPAGEIKGVSVVLSIDRDAALRSIALEEGRTFSDQPDATELQEMKTLLATFEDKHKQIVRDALPMDQTVTKVNVATVSFPKPVAMEGRPLMSQVGTWFAQHWTDLGLSVIVLFGILTLFNVMNRAVPAPIEIPSLEERVLIDEEKAGKEELEALRHELAQVTREDEGGSLENLVIPSDELEKNLEVANTVSDQRPESVATVIRTWMSGAASASKRRD